jgi:hypothetical protein
MGRFEGIDRWNTTKAQWDLLTYYQRFESAVALVLTLVIALIVLVGACLSTGLGGRYVGVGGDILSHPRRRPGGRSGAGRR